MPKALINGVNIHYQVNGEGPELVLIHGVTANMAFWYINILPQLMKEFRVVTYDLRGHGYSDATPDGYTSADMAPDLIKLLDYLDIKKAHLLGHSFGGVIALHAAALYPERVRSTVIADSEIPALRHLCKPENWLYWDEWRDYLLTLGVEASYEKWDDAEFFVRHSLPMPMQIGLRAGQARKTFRMVNLMESTTVLADITRVSGLTEEIIRGIRQPSLAIFGEYSPFLPACRFLRDNMPNCRAVIVPSDHFHPALIPDVFVLHTAEFLRDPDAYIRRKPPEEKSSVRMTPKTIMHVLANNLKRGTGETAKVE